MSSGIECTLDLLEAGEPLDRETTLKAEAFNEGVKLRGQYDEGFVSDSELRRGLRMHVVVTHLTDDLSMQQRFDLLDLAHRGAGLKQ